MLAERQMAFRKMRHLRKQVEGYPHLFFEKDDLKTLHIGAIPLTLDINRELDFETYFLSAFSYATSRSPPRH